MRQNSIICDRLWLYAEKFHIWKPSDKTELDTKPENVVKQFIQSICICNFQFQKLCRFWKTLMIALSGSRSRGKVGSIRTNYRFLWANEQKVGENRGR